MSATDKPDEPETGETTTTLDEAYDAGYLGTAPDPEPNESYAVGGKLAQAPERTGSASQPDDSKPDAPASSTAKSTPSSSSGKSSSSKSSS